MDSKLVVQWVNGLWDIYNKEYRKPVTDLQNFIEALRALGCMPRSPGADWRRHIYRELNSAADCEARKRGDEMHLYRRKVRPGSHFRVFTDGSCIGEGHSGCGFVVYVSASPVQDHEEDWALFATCHLDLPASMNSLDCEICGLQAALRFLLFLLRAPSDFCTRSVLDATRPSDWCRRPSALTWVDN